MTVGTIPTTVRDINAPQLVGEPLGYAVFWRLSGVRVPRHVLVPLVKQAGLAAHLPDPPSPTVALRRALLHWAAWKRVMPVLLRRAGQAPTVFVLLAEEPQQTLGQVSYRALLRACYDEARGQVSCTSTATGPIDATADPSLTRIVEGIWQREQEVHTGEDLSRFIRQVMVHLHAVRLQRGVYFVPASQAEPLLRLDKLIAALPGSPLLATLAQYDQAQTRRKIARAVHREFITALQTMEEQFERVLEAPGNITLTTLSQQMTRFHRLQERAQAYTDLLGAWHADLEARLAALKARAQQLVLVPLDEEQQG